MDKRGISVIIPAYNAEDSIFDSISSALSARSVAQVICIDDGSTDKTAEIVRTVHDSRLLLVQQENSGVSRARNVGIRLSRAEYLAFLDADDLYEPDRLDAIYDRIPVGGVDVAAFGVASYHIEDGPSAATLDKGYYFPLAEANCMTGIEFSVSLRKHHTELGSSCRSLFSREFIQKLNIGFYPGMKISEDTLFCREALLFAEKVMSYNDPVLIRSYSPLSCTGKAKPIDYIRARILLRNRFGAFADSRSLTKIQSDYVSKRIEWDTKILVRDISQLTRQDYSDLTNELNLMKDDPYLYKVLNKSLQLRVPISLWRHLRRMGARIVKAVFR